MDRHDIASHEKYHLVKITNLNDLILPGGVRECQGRGGHD